MKTFICVQAKCPYCGFVNKLDIPFQHPHGYKTVVRCDNRKGGCFKEFVLDIKMVATELRIEGEGDWVKAIAKVTSYMEDLEDFSPWIIKGNAYTLTKVNDPSPNSYHFIDEEGDDHYISIADFDDFFKEVD